MTNLQKLIIFNKKNLNIGLDEAGRGSLAGPLVASALYLPPKFDISNLDDSKKLKAKTRFELKNRLEQDKKVVFAVSFINEKTIDEINILQATFLAMHTALDDLSISPKKLWIDGNRFLPYKNIPFECVIKGDGKIACIAAASIMAKTYRDLYMDKIHLEYPMYGWNKNKGYGTLLHRQAIEKYGLSPYHRKSFTIKPTQLKFSF